jgi:hypothetical protein
MKSENKNKEYQKNNRLVYDEISSQFSSFEFIGFESQRYFINIKVEKMFTTMIKALYLLK